jgi:hypothetical protein
LHSVVEADGGYRQTQIVFSIQADCFTGEGTPLRSRVVGANGVNQYAEPYDAPDVLFMPEREEGQITGAYELRIEGRTLCVYLTWDASTTEEELAAARQVVESIRGEAHGSDGLRIVFSLPEGWDVG